MFNTKFVRPNAIQMNNSTMQPYFNVFVYSTVFFSLFFVDYLLGNGFVVGFKRCVCKTACYAKSLLRHNLRNHDTEVDHPNIYVFATELIILAFTMTLLNRYKKIRGRDKIDELLEESKDALKQTNEFLEKWRIRKVPNEYSYLDEEPQKIEPWNLEVPILHMAIVDTTGTSRLPERGDAGDAINITDSTLLSMTSLLDDDLEDFDPFLQTGSNDLVDELKIMELKNRFLWDVAEEDLGNLAED